MYLTNSGFKYPAPTVSTEFDDNGSSFVFVVSVISGLHTKPLDRLRGHCKSLGVSLYIETLTFNKWHTAVDKQDYYKASIFESQQRAIETGCKCIYVEPSTGLATAWEVLPSFDADVSIIMGGSKPKVCLSGTDGLSLLKEWGSNYITKHKDKSLSQCLNITLSYHLDNLESVPQYNDVFGKVFDKDMTDEEVERVGYC